MSFLPDARITWFSGFRTILLLLTSMCMNNAPICSIFPLTNLSHLSRISSLRSTKLNHECQVALQKKKNHHKKLIRKKFFEVQTRSMRDDFRSHPSSRDLNPIIQNESATQTRGGLETINPFYLEGFPNAPTLVLARVRQ